MTVPYRKKLIKVGLPLVAMNATASAHFGGFW